MPLHARALFRGGPFLPARSRAPAPGRLRRSLRASVAEGVVAEWVMACVGGAVITGWALYLGCGPMMLALLGALPFLGGTRRCAGSSRTAPSGTRRSGCPGRSSPSSSWRTCGTAFALASAAGGLLVQALPGTLLLAGHACTPLRLTFLLAAIVRAGAAFLSRRLLDPTAVARAIPPPAPAVAATAAPPAT